MGRQKKRSVPKKKDNSWKKEKKRQRNEGIDIKKQGIKEEKMGKNRLKNCVNKK